MNTRTCEAQVPTTYVYLTRKYVVCSLPRATSQLVNGQQSDGGVKRQKWPSPAESIFDGCFEGRSFDRTIFHRIMTLRDSKRYIWCVPY
jgi:hypothetical protein